MKAKELLVTCCNRGISMEDFQVVEIESPYEDCNRLFGDFKACVLPAPGSYLAQWCELDELSLIGEADALLVMDASPVNVVHLYRID